MSIIRKFFLPKMPSNSAAWIPTALAKPLVVNSAPYASPGEKEIVIKNGAVAINPMDWIIQDMGPSVFAWLEYPLIGGGDVAGEVADVGSAVTTLKPGDRVVGHALGFMARNNKEGAFQNYSIVQSHMASRIPDSLSYENAAVLPLGISTAACGLFQKDFLALEHPSITPKPTGETLLVWAGSSSVGSNAIQLAVAAGYEVITTASPKNFDFVKKLGASQAFDYHDQELKSKLVDAFKGKKCAGALAIYPGSGEVCMEVIARSDGRKFVAFAMPLGPDEPPAGVEAKMIFGGTLRDNEVGSLIYEQFLPQALAKGLYVAAPSPRVIGKGLENIQSGLDAVKNGVSAQKVVVSL